MKLMNPRPIAVLIALVTALSGCSRSTDLPETTTIAPQAAEWTQRIALGGNASVIRGSALLGVYLAHHLINEILFSSALAGITAQMSFLSESSQEQDESFALLETLGSILQVDIPDMLNRSPVRSIAFDTYAANLQNLTKRAIAHQESIEQELDGLNDLRRAARGDAAKTQSVLNRTIRDGDFTTASNLQKSLIEQEGEAARLEAEIDTKRSIKNLFIDMLDVAEERLTVMAANRAALLAGITVVDLPGAKDLGILRKGTREERSGDSIFDPETLR